MNEGRTYEQEIDLKDLLMAVLRKWRSIIIVAIMLAFLLGGYKLGEGLLKQMDVAAITIAQEEYEEAKAIYETNKSSYEREIENIIANIEMHTEYAEKSILMNTSPYDKYESSVDIFIKTNYKIMPDMVYQNYNYTDSILMAYSSAIKSGKLVEKIAKSMDMDVRYIEELISVKTDFNNKMIQCTVSFSDESRANKVLDEILFGMEDIKADLIVAIGDHTISTLNRSTGAIVDLELAQLQKSNNENINTLQEALVTKKKVLKELKEPEPIALSKQSTLKRGIKYAILGGILGGFMMVLFHCVSFLLSDKISSAKDIRNRFGIKILGQFQEDKKKKIFLDKWIDRIEERDASISLETVYDVIVANIKNYSPQVGRILLMGSTSEEILLQTASALSDRLSGYEIIIGGSIRTNASTLQKLPTCKGVILVEHIGLSTNASVMEEVDTVNNLEKELIGCILVSA